MRRVSAGVSVLVGFLLLLAACAPPGVPVADPNYDAQGKRFEAPSQGMAALYIANVDRPNSGAPPLTVSIGPRQLGTLANSTWYRVELAPGAAIRLSWPAGSQHWFDAQTGLRLDP